MRRLRYLFLSAVVVALAVTRLPAQDVYPNEFANNAVAATDTSQLVSFGFSALSVTLVNDGANEVFFSLSPTATTASFKLLTGESWSGPIPSAAKGVALVCSAGETATIRVGAWR